MDDEEINRAIINNEYGPYVTREVIKNYDVDEDDRSVLFNKAKEIAQILCKIDNNHPQRLIPIYDIDGNLWWPRQMTYEEVKQFVAEREKKKENEQEEIASSDVTSESQ